MIYKRAFFFYLITIAGSLLGNVQLIDQGTSIIMDNGIISLEIEKDFARIISLNKGTKELMPSGGGGFFNGGVGYFQRISLDDQYTMPENCTYNVVRNTPDIVETSLVEDNPVRYPFRFDTHFVLKKDESGFYNFIILENPQPQANIIQLNLCLALDSDTLTMVQVSDNRWMLLPTPEDIANGEKITPSTVKVPPDSNYAQMYEDDIYAKYNLAALYDDAHIVHGLCGNGYGVWVIRSSNEYLNGVPDSQELTAHAGVYSDYVILLGMAHGVHFGSGDLVLNLPQDNNWRKVYGPQFIYLNEGSTRVEMWTDAKNQASDHVAQWPYQWMNDPCYPTLRGTVHGQINITNGSDPNGTLVVLAQPEDDDIPNWQKQGRGYTFFSRADSNGVFVIENVREGSYSLYANVDGILDEYRHDGVSVIAGNQTNLGVLNWTPLKYGREEWQIGIPNRDSTEFKSGDDFRHWGGVMRDRYMQDFPDGVNYIIGSSNWNEDWNYAQVTIDDGAGGYEGTEWKINFNLDREYDEGTAHLRIGVAGRSSGSVLKVWLGRHLLANFNLDAGSEYPDGGYPRSGSRGYYEEKVVAFNASYLSEGTNTLILHQATNTEFACIHYDCVRLELPYKADTNSDNEVNIIDLEQLAIEWLTYGDLADFNNDGKIDFKDLSILATEWHN